VEEAMGDEENLYLIVAIPLVLAILFLLILSRYDPTIWLRKRLDRRRLMRVSLSDGGEQYVEDTPEGKLYEALQSQCPSCKARPPRYIEGPSGGMSTNIFCERCGQGYNITPMVGIAEMIHKDARYIIKEANVVSIVPDQDEGKR
jgi:hypothetical protein